MSVCRVVACLLLWLGSVVLAEAVQFGAGTGTGYPAAVDTVNSRTNAAGYDPCSSATTDNWCAEFVNDIQGAVTAIQTELGTLPKGGSASVKARLDTLAPLASPTFTGVVTIPTPFTLGGVSVTPTGTELNFVDGVTSAIQTQLDGKQASLGFTPPANTLTLTAGAGLSGGGDLSINRSFATDSGEADFVASGALTCGASTQGKVKVHTTPLQYCDNSATPTLRYTTYGDSTGKASIALDLQAVSSVVSDAEVDDTITLTNLTQVTTRSHTSLSDIGTNAHSTIDTFIASKAAASGLASLDGSSLVVQNPANATVTATASKIPIADGSGKVDTWTTIGASIDDGEIPSGITRDTEVNVQGTASEITSSGSGVSPTLSIADTFRLTGKTVTAPVKTGTAAPGTCTVGDFFFDTDATAGQNTYACTATNVWTLQGDGGGGSSPLTTKGDLYGFTTVNARVPIGTNGARLTADSGSSSGLSWLLPATNTVATSETTTSASYTDLATSGPAVTVTIGASGTALVIITAHITVPSTARITAMSFAVSGASTVSASDARALFVDRPSEEARSSTVMFLTGLTAGSNTFTAKYRSTLGSTGTFADRDITVIPF